MAVSVHSRVYAMTTGHQSTSELDSHADTCVASANFRMIETTGESVDVQAYNENYPAIPNVPIVWAATAWTSLETGETFILDFFQVLWYGDEMKQSLINPNQLRALGLLVCDDPTNPY